MNSSTNSFVYVIGPPGSGRVKIGTSLNPQKRLKELQTGNPDRLEVLWAAPGGRDLESALHRTFSAYRIEGEWFDFGTIEPVGAIPRAVHSYLNPKPRGQAAAALPPRGPQAERSDVITPERLAGIVRDVVLGARHSPDPEEEAEQEEVKPRRTARVDRDMNRLMAFLYGQLASNHASRSLQGETGFAAFGGWLALTYFVLTLPIATPFGAFLTLRTAARDIWPVRKLPVLALFGFAAWDIFGFDRLIRDQVLSRLPLQEFESFLRTYFTEAVTTTAWLLCCAGFLMPVAGYALLLKEKKEEAEEAKTHTEAKTENVQTKPKEETPSSDALATALVAPPSHMPPSPLIADLLRSVPRQATEQKPVRASITEEGHALQKDAVDVTNGPKSGCPSPPS